MKRFSTILLLVISLPLLAQTNSENEIRTIFDNDSDRGGYGALSMGYSEIDGRNALVVGGRGMWIINHSIGLGIGGNGFINDPEQDPADNTYYNLSGGYGGLIIEPVIFSRWPVHLSFPTLLGTGAIARTSFNEQVFVQPGDAYLEEASLFLVAEPGIELEFNVLDWLRLAFFGTYRFTTQLNMIDVDSRALLGWNAGITLKVGSF